MWNSDELRDRAWELASPVLHQHLDNALQRYESALGTDKIADDIRNVVLAASDGRVDTLFLEKSRRVWGRVDVDLRAVHLTPNDIPQAEELMDFAAAHTLIHGGNVYALDHDRLPSGESSLAALLRYAS